MFIPNCVAINPIVVETFVEALQMSSLFMLVLQRKSGDHHSH